MPTRKAGTGTKKKTTDGTNAVWHRDLMLNPSITTAYLKKKQPMHLQDISIRTIKHIPHKDLHLPSRCEDKKPLLTSPMMRRRPQFWFSLHEVGLLQTSAQIVSTQSLPPEMGARFRFFGDKPAVASCRLAGSAPHKSGGRRVKSWPDDTHRQTHSSHLDLGPLSQTDKQETNLNQM